MTKGQKLLTVTGLAALVGALVAFGFEDPTHALFLLAKRLLIAVF